MLETTLSIAKDVLSSVLGSFIYDKLSDSRKQALAMQIAGEVESQLRQYRRATPIEIKSTARSIAGNVIPKYQIDLIQALFDDADRLAREADVLSNQINAN